MNDDQQLPGVDEYATAVNDWLQETDLAGRTEPAPAVHLPQADAPVTVVRPVRLPQEIDAMVRALAAARGVSMSDLIRDWVMTGLAEARDVGALDPVTELRHSLVVAQRALEQLSARDRRAA